MNGKFGQPPEKEVAPLLIGVKSLFDSLLDKVCVHCYTQNGQHLVVDGNSGAVHVVDEEALDLIENIKANPEIQTLQDLQIFIKGQAIDSTLASEVVELIEGGLLFSPDLMEVPPRPDSVVKALCLNVAHDCNLRCQYCFASSGDFGGDRELMPLDVAKQAVDFLLEASKHRKQIEIDFFGGEPLLNWDVVRETVLYGNEQGVKFGKTFRFTMTTNGLGLTPEIEAFLNEHMYNVVLSIDGRKEINDRVRETISKRGSVYEIIVPKFKRLVDNRNGNSYYVRGTFTSYNLDFGNDVAHLSELGFDQISMEPVVTDPDEEYALREEHVSQIQAEYERLAELYLERKNTDQDFNFFHFNVELKKGPCLYKRLSGCGAGYEYLAVATSGDLYPCHQFVGEEDFIVGTVWTGLVDETIPAQLKDSHVLNKPVCKGCWAKYYCSGGCHKNNLVYAGDLLTPHELSCNMERKRLECAFYIQAALATRALG